jgi:transposase
MVANGDVLAPAGRRRVFRAEEKAVLLAEIDAEGGRVRLVARRHGLSESLLYNWRTARKAAALAMGASEPVTFVPVGVLSQAAPQAKPALTVPAIQAAAEATSGDARAGSIEIALANGARLSVDAFVNEKALARVLRAMKGAA